MFTLYSNHLVVIATYGVLEVGCHLFRPLKCRQLIQGFTKHKGTSICFLLLFTIFVDRAFGYCIAMWRPRTNNRVFRAEHVTAAILFSYIQVCTPNMNQWVIKRARSVLWLYGHSLLTFWSWHCNKQFRKLYPINTDVKSDNDAYLQWKMFDLMFAEMLTNTVYNFPPTQFK